MRTRAGVGEGHGNVSIAGDENAEMTRFGFGGETGLEDATFDHLQKQA